MPGSGEATSTAEILIEEFNSELTPYQLQRYVDRAEADTHPGLDIEHSGLYVIVEEVKDGDGELDLRAQPMLISARFFPTFEAEVVPLLRRDHRVEERRRHEHLMRISDFLLEAS